jgi:serine kinase of HPr protein (carbohydrate metabolism regulator)
VLLVGESGAGKSTLAYLAQTEGLEVLSEDTVWIQIIPVLRVWGRPRALHLLPGAEAHFPELRANAVSLRPNGKSKLTVPTGPADEQWTCAVNGAMVCLLQRGAASAQLSRLGTAAVYEALARSPSAGFDRYPERREECARRLAENGGWQLSLSADPREALPLLRELIRNGAA